jgi:hypothetical protein
MALISSRLHPSTIFPWETNDESRALISGFRHSAHCERRYPILDARSPLRDLRNPLSDELRPLDR